jgi:hypothetical protein
MAGIYEQHKEAAGSFAMMVWIGVGIYLFAVNDAASFVSWQGAIYFIGGMFASALVLGMASHAVRRVIAKILTKVLSSPSAGVA